MVYTMETPVEAFERLRQALNVLKDHHYDPWNWHEYLSDEPEEGEEEEEEEEELFKDLEMLALKPKRRKNIDKLKAHLLTVVQELNRAGHAADLAYYYMSVQPELMKECVVIMGVAGDIDEDLLNDSGDASPEKIMAALQAKLDAAHERIEELTDEVTDLKKRLKQKTEESEDRWGHWQRSKMQGEEAMQRLDETTRSLMMVLEREGKLAAAYNDLYARHNRARKLMIYKGTHLMRDRLFLRNKTENLFYGFHGFCAVLQQEKEERIRRELEEMRDSVEFALRNEVRWLISENSLCNASAKRLTEETNRLKLDRRALAKRLLYKQRPYEPNEYLLWIWEMWQSLRGGLRLEKSLEREKATVAAVNQQFTWTSRQMVPLMDFLDQLRMDVVKEQMQGDIVRRELVAASARQFAALADQLRLQRAQELDMLLRLRDLENEAKDERIAVLEREIAEDKHIHALKGMIVDLETNLRRALDRRKQRSYVVPPANGPRCVQCGRETSFRGWKLPPDGLTRSASEVDLSRSATSPLAPRTKTSFPERSPRTNRTQAWPEEEKEAKFTAVWR